MFVLSPSLLSSWFPPRTKDTHKGLFGHVGILGGDEGMPGALRLCGEAAARVGSGLVSVFTRKEHLMGMVWARPEIMCHEVTFPVKPLLKRITVLAIGPGLGQKQWGQDLFHEMMKECNAMKIPYVLDADALNLLAQHPQKNPHWILTPHPQEAARLLQCSAEEVQENRESAVEKIQKQYGGVCVLKGADTLICDGKEPVTLCPFGNPGMSSGGMGDVLTGVIAGLLAQGLSPYQAASLGAMIHGLAADDAAREEGERGLLALDLMPRLRRWVNGACG